LDVMGVRSRISYMSVVGLLAYCRSSWCMYTQELIIALWVYPDGYEMGLCIISNMVNIIQAGHRSTFSCVCVCVCVYNANVRGNGETTISLVLFDRSTTSLELLV
jgi:hypothetical protein